MNSFFLCFCQEMSMRAVCHKGFRIKFPLKTFAARLNPARAVAEIFRFTKCCDIAKSCHNVTALNQLNHFYFPETSTTYRLHFERVHRNARSQKYIMPNAKELYIQAREDAGIIDNARNQAAWQDIVDNNPAELNIWLAKATQGAAPTGPLWASQALARIAAAWKAQKFNSSPNINLVWPYGGRDVYIKGTWTNWQPIRMVYNGSVHTYPLFYSFGVKYIYCFILDGKVCHNGLSAAEPNVYGGYNNYYYGLQLMGSPARDSQFYDISNNSRLVVSIEGGDNSSSGSDNSSAQAYHGSTPHGSDSDPLASINPPDVSLKYYLQFLGVIEQYDK
ncbi:hypothetical protein PROFUN_12878 [Planoprotostelium fungivorum]|uniref:AMP-activated protein kinase glycogen-binding domain-containing protein n=1 Tax=Planoprotostelium fungivorum TaxID=1890364 RepID=A0A2P6N6E2_9EUKA|nr:hypothetical protein PROFUN_12878 [Planoprotostelium fungivorum]